MYTFLTMSRIEITSLRPHLIYFSNNMRTKVIKIFKIVKQIIYLIINICEECLKKFLMVDDNDVRKFKFKYMRCIRNTVLITLFLHKKLKSYTSLNKND